MRLPFQRGLPPRSPLAYLLSTSGLVACYLPYMDVVGRNIADASPYLWNFSYNPTTKKLTRNNKTTSGIAAFTGFVIKDTRSVLRMWVSKAEYDYCRVETRGAYGAAGWAWFVFDLTTGAVTDEQVGSIASVINSKEIVWDGDMSAWRVTVDYTYLSTNAGLASIYGTPDGTYGYTGDGSSGMYVHQWQHNLGQLYPYSAPVGTSQSVVDRSGLGNHAQLGSTSGVDTNDPLWSHVSNYFDGVDDVYSNWPDTEYELHAWGSAINSFGWVSAVPTETLGHYFGGILLNRTPGAGEEARIKAAMRALLASRGVTLA